MHPEQYEDRKRYINAIKNSFATSGQPLNANEQAGDNNRSEKVPHSFFRCPFFSCTLPVSCLFCHKTDRHFLERMGCKENHPTASVYHGCIRHF